MVIFHLQEIQTIVGYSLPIKLFILNNDGYLSIKQTQQNYFDGRFVGCDPKSGLTFPDFSKLVTAYDIPYRTCRNHSEMRQMIRDNLQGNGPQICEVFLDLAQGFEPKLSSRKLEDGSMVSSSLEDMFPFLSREELEENMFIPLLDT